MNKTSTQEWIARRADEIRKHYSAFQCLQEHGHGEMLVDEDTAIQIFCPLHSNVNTPAARYYPASGTRSDYVRCYRCRENWDAPNLYARFKGIRFMEALQQLERRFGVRIPRKPDAPDIEEPADKSSADYLSPAWKDIPRILTILEKKLHRIRDKTPLIEYIKFCRVLDSVQWDFDIAKGVATEQMSVILNKLRTRMDEHSAGPEEAGNSNAQNGV